MRTTRREALFAATTLAAAAALTKESVAEPKPAAAPVNGAADALAEAVSVFDLEAIAHRNMTRNAWEYINSGAADEITLRWNREAYDRLRLHPRNLRVEGAVDTRVKLLGLDLPHPIFLAPTALHKLAHPEGEVATAKGAGGGGAAMVLSTMSSVSLEDVSKNASGPLWFQLYVQKDKGFTADLVHRAVAAGYKALVVTVDTPVEGARNRQERAHFHLPPGVALENLKGLKAGLGWSPGTEKEVFRAILPEGLTWKDIEWLQSLSKLPVLLKGILHADDADQAARMGLAGVLVSNHGGRNLDTVPATIDALPRITDKVGGRIAVLVDGGIRRGTDVLKALALGANAVLIGRPVLYGLSAGGADGVTHAVNILRKELELALALTGRTSIAGLDRTVLWS